MRMEVYRGKNHVTPVECEVEPVAPGIGRIVCPECGGDQKRYRSLFPPGLGIAECVDCKGTGFIYVDM
jgi:hypothetical protein